ncbi:alanine racemase [Brachybacterium huguangmaarense]|uniref:Alanine racemase n=1 Tax=Brachybacterium huguangmaarense TaxID=1652028 RepID=A0ABY6G2T1_9MICO|nr:alanine racemase [Brachybacterium huguangmaarense]UYG16939.1 alanine racemase [Brachybacterium huguangmaarense]
MSVAIPAEDPRHIPNRAVIDPGAITHNTRAMASLLEEQTALMAIVKADGYGHGMLTAARAALEGGATWLGVAHPASALALARAGLDVPIFTWLYEPVTAAEVLPEVIDAGIDVSVGSLKMLRLVSEAARSVDRRARVHVKIDSGMGRNGVLTSQVAGLGGEIGEDDHVQLVAAWTHLSVADDPADPETDRQIDEFDAACEILGQETGPVPLQHVANSAATISRPDLHRDIVRPGIALYGYPPLPLPDGKRLRPAMSLTSRLALVKDVEAGQHVGYGHTYTTPAPTRLGLVPIGYADGLHRAASGQVDVMVRTRIGDQTARQVGRISMDQIVIDLGPDSKAQSGDQVILFGERAQAVLDDGTVPTAEDWARAAGTIPYEMLTSVSSRVTREVQS